jgi:monoterpene epsilon-lactone hydrolase
MTSDELAALKGMLAAAPFDFASPALEVRAAFDGATATFPVDESYTFATKTIGGVSGLWMDAESSSPAVLLYIHGGAMLVGTAFGFRGLSGNLARAAGVNHFSIDYRLAPEHAFPAALDDALAAYLGLIEAGYAAENIVVAGDSAGGGLVLSLLLSLKERGVAQPAGALTLSPWADLTLSGDTIVSKKSADGSLTQLGLQAGADQYLVLHSATDPLASPLFGDLAGIAPLLIEVGSDEILLSDSTRLAHRAGEALVDVTLHVWPNMVHDWSLFSFMLSEGRDMIAEAGAWLTTKLAK